MLFPYIIVIFFFMFLFCDVYGCWVLLFPLLVCGNGNFNDYDVPVDGSDVYEGDNDNNYKSDNN